MNIIDSNITMASSTLDEYYGSAISADNADIKLN